MSDRPELDPFAKQMHAALTQPRDDADRDDRGDRILRRVAWVCAVLGAVSIAWPILTALLR